MLPSFVWVSLTLICVFAIGWALVSERKR
jgi:hypothetical protein